MNPVDLEKPNDSLHKEWTYENKNTCSLLIGHIGEFCSF
jgi:hypothetical protein